MATKKRKTTRKTAAKRKPTRKTATRRTTAKRSTSRRRKATKKNMTGREFLMNTAAGVVGAIGTGALVSRIPNVDPRIKAAAPILVGAALAMSKMGKKNKMIQMAGAGAAVAGGLALTKQLAPQIPILAGEDDFYDETEVYIPNSDMMGAALLGGPMAGPMAGDWGTSVSEW